MEPHHQDPQHSKLPYREIISEFALPLALIISSIILGIAFYFGLVSLNGTTARVANTATAPLAQEEQNAGSLDAMREVTKKDHIRGDINAKVKIVEYSDTECPYCKQFHQTLKKLSAEYGNKVAWVYRHFPLDQLHKKARKEAEATECAAELGGEASFWKYIDKVYELTPSNDGLAEAQLPQIAQSIGLNVARFNECLKSGRHAARVQADYEDAAATGGQGTPWSILITKDGSKVAINGAQPYEALKAALDAALK